MSLWNKKLSDIDFSDLDTFCKTSYSEGIQLDYKRNIPSNLAKTVAAFANTRGGLILLGVDSDKATNEPIWPCDGMEIKDGYPEQIVQICRDGVYPPILPEVSSLIGNPESPGKAFLVVRINESPESPHSINNDTKVYVRTGDVSKPVDLAQVSQIALLLERRQAPEVVRESLIARHLIRFTDYMPKGGEPYFWFCVLPEFPHEELCLASECKDGVVGGPGKRVLDGYSRFKQPPHESRDWSLASVGKHGDLFYGRQFNRLAFPLGENSGEGANNRPFISGQYLANLMCTFLNHCQAFLNKDFVKYPGILRILVGGEDLQGASLMDRNGFAGGAFIDRELRIERLISLEAFSDDELCFNLASEIMADLFHAFNFPGPPPRQDWSFLSTM